MPITNYSIIVGSSPDEIRDKLSQDQLSPVGQAVPYRNVILQSAGSGWVDQFGNVTNYTLLSDTTPEGLAAKVNAKLSEGMQPIGGGVLVRGVVFMQGVGMVAHEA